MSDVPFYVLNGIDWFRTEMKTYMDIAFRMPHEEGKKYLLDCLESGTKELERADFYFGPNKPSGV